MLRQIWWTSVPIWSLGSLSFVPFLAFAVIQRRKQDWAVFAAYLAATAALIVAVALTPADSGWAAAAGLSLFALIAGAATHACILFRPGRPPVDQGIGRAAAQPGGGAGGQEPDRAPE